MTPNPERVTAGCIQRWCRPYRDLMRVTVSFLRASARSYSIPSLSGRGRKPTLRSIAAVLHCGCLAAVLLIAGCSSPEAPATVGEDTTAPAAEVKTPAADSKSKASAAVEPVTTALTTEVPPVAVAPSNAIDSNEKLLLMLTVFVLAVFVGVEIITKIPPTLHTPLMSGSNAISGITLIGALLATGSGQGAFASFLGFFAVVFATVNVVGGFLVTHRMLDMFRKKK